MLNRGTQPEMSVDIMNFRTAFRACRIELVSAGILSLFINLLFLTFPLYMLQIFSRVLASRSVDTLVMLTLMAVGALVLFGVLTALRSRILARMSAKLDTLLGERIHAALIARSLRTNDSRDVQALRDLSQVRNFLAGSDIHALFDAPWTPFLIAAIFLFSPILGMVAALGAVVLFVIAIANDLLTRKSLSAANAASVKAYKNATSNVRNAEVIESMGMTSAAMARWRQHNSEVLYSQGLATDRSGSLTALSRTIRFILQILIFGVGAYLVIQRMATPGIMIAAVILMGRALSPVDAAIHTWKSLLSARAASRRLEELLQRVPLRSSAAMPLPPPQGRLAVEQLAFLPPGGDRPILKGLSFALEAGESLGIVGPTAAGKSTLAKLVVGVLRPSTGYVRLDGADVATWDPEDLGQYVGYLPQAFELFEGTVRENIGRMGDAPADEVIAAARLAGIHEMILQMPKGYETKIGDGGSILSGGQQQRIALARALFGKPRLLVLDEPNSNLDTEGEEALGRALVDLKAGGTTTLVIAHRPTILANVDKILVLKNGRVDSFGPSAEVMAKIVPQAMRPRVVTMSQSGNSTSS